MEVFHFFIYRMKVAAILLLCLLGVAIAQNVCPASLLAKTPDDSIMNAIMPVKAKAFEKYRAEGQLPFATEARAAVQCNFLGSAGEYPCENIDLQAFVPLANLGPINPNREGNDIWGWTDPVTGQEIAIVGLRDGSSFVDITNPTAPVVLAFLPTQTVSSSWRDMKVYNNYAFIVSEARDHGMQIYDLTQLRQYDGSTIVSVVPTALYTQFGSSHNIVINEATGFAYSVGTKTCNGGLHIVDISDPLNPTCAGCYATDGYVHDAQCVVYEGPDSQHTGKEICFCYNEDTLTIVDVSDKSNFVQLARVPYSGSQYTHQGWLSSDWTYVFLNDELDEVEGTTGGPNPANTRTLVWDVTTLANPTLLGSFYSTETVIDHNLYVNGSLIYESNYCGGLRVLEITNSQPGSLPTLTQVGFFDVAPQCSTTEFLGTWSNYPYFASGNIIVNSIERGLYVLKSSGFSNN